jgi:hypothetical protein
MALGTQLPPGNERRREPPPIKIRTRPPMSERRRPGSVGFAHRTKTCPAYTRSTCQSTNRRPRLLSHGQRFPAPTIRPTTGRAQDAAEWEELERPVRTASSAIREGHQPARFGAAEAAPNKEAPSTQSPPPRRVRGRPTLAERQRDARF